MGYGEKPELTPGRLAIILACLAILTGVSIWHLFFREIPPAMHEPEGALLIELQGETMGTYYNVKVFPGEAANFPSAPAIEETVQRELNAVDAKMSTYREDSELSRFNRLESDEPFQFSEETFEVIQLAQRVSEQTGGAFDVTVGPLVNAWGFGPGGEVEAPGDARVAELREQVGYALLELDPVARTVSKRRPGVYVDLSAIAKGYAVDEVAEALDDLGLENYMIEVGGEVRTSGHNGEGDPWRIGIERPAEGTRQVHTVVPLSGLAMASSGDYRNYTERDGERISHTIDPRTGRPVPHLVASVTVIHHNCAHADALATALTVLGPDEGLAFAEQIGLPVLFLIHAEDGLEERTSSAFEAMIRAERTASTENAA